MAISSTTRNRINNVLASSNGSGNNNNNTSGNNNNNNSGSSRKSSSSSKKKQQQPRSYIHRDILCSNPNNLSIGGRISRLFGSMLDRKLCGTPLYVVLNRVIDCCHTGFEHFVYFLGPVLIVLASGIIVLLGYTFYTILVPMYKDYYNTQFSYLMVYVHMFVATFFFVNVIYNYFLCVTTKNSSGPSYDLVVRQMASMTGFTYPETNEQLKQYEYDFDSKMRIRMKCRQDRRRERTIQVTAKASKASQEIAYGTNDDDEETLGNSNASSSSSFAADAKPTTTALLEKKTRRRRRASGDNKEGTTSSSCYSTDEDTKDTKTKTAARKKAPNNKMSPQHNSLSSPPQNTKIVGLGPSPGLGPPPSVNTNSNGGGGGGGGGGAGDGTLRQWMLLGPYEWGFCLRTNQPKPPRSHFDHVTKGLVLCLDHYCPWMFNSVGYFNYRYFVNFLIFVTWGMIYGACIMFTPFQQLSTTSYRNQIRYNKHQKQEYLNSKNHDDGYQLKRIEAMVPHPDERMPITLSFMMCSAVGTAVFILFAFHIYLTLTAQTTIEFHGNYTSKRRAKKVGKVWKNPYDFGWKRNWQQVYGTQNVLLAILPSNREPEFLPVPMLGDRGKRPNPKSSSSSHSYSLLKDSNSTISKPIDVLVDEHDQPQNDNNNYDHQDRITVGTGIETTSTTTQDPRVPTIV